MKNLYSFSKNAWHVKLFKWLYNVDPTQKFKNMCPYFWICFLTFWILPIVVIGRLCGNLSSKVYHWYNTQKRDRYEKRKSKFLERCNKISTPLEAYNLWRSKDWDEFNYYIPYELYIKIKDLKISHAKTITYKPSTIDINWDLVLSIIAILGLLTIVVVGIYNIEWRPIDWGVLFGALWILFKFSCFVAGFYSILKYLFYNDKAFKILDKIMDFIILIACKVWHGIRIVGDMIYNIYKKNCPLIEWKE